MLVLSLILRAGKLGKFLNRSVSYNPFLRTPLTPEGVCPAPQVKAIREFLENQKTDVW